jgi:AGZA family xanthine/uracil permease-like MFS transporter
LTTTVVGTVPSQGGPAEPDTKPGLPRNAVDRFFKVTERGSTFVSEVRGGLSTFFVMSYIVILNPIILTSAKDVTGHTLNFGQVTTSTALVAAVMCLLMGLTANLPVAMASGMGLNAVFAFSVAARMTWPETWGLAVWSGIIIMFLVVTGLRQAIVRALPGEVKGGIAAGIGAFIAFIGLVDSGFVRAGAGTPVTLGQNGVLRGWPTLVFAVGLALTYFLWVRKSRGALLIGIVATTALAIVINHFEHISGMTNASGKVVNGSGWQLNVPVLPHKLVALPDFGLLGHVSMTGGFTRVGLAAGFALFSVCLADFFDATGTLTGIANHAGLAKDDRIPRFGTALFVDGLGASVGGLAGASTSTAYIESNAGVADGARTGLASIVTAACFVVALFLSPLIEVVPSEAATPALVVVGLIMLLQFIESHWKDRVALAAAGVIILVMPATYSITDGVGAGILAFLIGRAAQGKLRQLHPLVWVISAMFLVYFFLYPIQQVLGVN